MTQGSRDDIIVGFKQKKFPILVATDVAGEVLALQGVWLVYYSRL